MLWEGRISKSGRLRAVDGLRKCAMEEGVLHVKLMNGPILGVCEGYDCANSGQFDDRAESFVIIHAGSLSEPSKHPTSLVALQRTISIELVFEYPFASDHIGFGRAGNMIPSMIALESSIFIFHGLAPMRISESIPAGPRERRQGLGMQGRARLPVPCCSMGRHTMGVGIRWDGYCTSRDRRVALDVAWRRRDHAEASRRSPCRVLGG